jgi:hypothetical protein
MRKMSKAAKAEAYDALDRERALLAEFAYFMVNADTLPPDARHTDDESNCVTEYRLYGVDRSHGGLLAIIVDERGLHRSVRVHDFEEWLRDVKAMSHHDSTYPAKVAAETLERIRRMSWQKVAGAMGHAACTHAPFVCTDPHCGAHR